MSLASLPVAAISRLTSAALSVRYFSVTPVTGSNVLSSKLAFAVRASWCGAAGLLSVAADASLVGSDVEVLIVVEAALAALCVSRNRCFFRCRAEARFGMLYFVVIWVWAWFQNNVVWRFLRGVQLSSRYLVGRESVVMTAFAILR